MAEVIDFANIAFAVELADRLRLVFAVLEYDVSIVDVRGISEDKGTFLHSWTSVKQFSQVFGL